MNFHALFISRAFFRDLFRHRCNPAFIFMAICVLLPVLICFTMPAMSGEEPADESEKVVIYRPDRSTISINHPGGDDENFESYSESMVFRNLPPASFIKKVVLMGKVSASGSVKELQTRVMINGNEQEQLSVTVPGFMVDLFKTMANNIDLQGSIKIEEVRSNLGDGGDFTLAGFLKIKGSAPFSVKVLNMRAAITMRSGTAMPFPVKIDCPPILEPASSVKIKPSKFKDYEVYKGSDFKVSLLWDGSEVSSTNLAMDDGALESQKKLLELFWLSGEFVNSETSPGEHTIQIQSEFTEADENGFMLGSNTIFAPPDPKKVLVLFPESASSYYPTAFVNLLGADRIDEDLNCSWAFSYQATFSKGEPSPLTVRTQEAANGYSGVIPGSIQYTVDWGDGTPPAPPASLVPVQNKVWQDSLNLSHLYTRPGEFQMEVRLHYKLRRFRPKPNLEELVSWEPYDTVPEFVSARKRIVVKDKTPPVISDEYYIFDVPKYGYVEDATDSGETYHFEIIAKDNSPEILSEAILNYQMGDLWLKKIAASIIRTTPPGFVPAEFKCHFGIDIPRNIATKPPVEKRYPHYLVVTDAAGNINDGDLDIRDNDSPPNYNADTRGALGHFVVYDSIAPGIKISYRDPKTRSLMEFAALSQKGGGNDWFMLVAAHETPEDSTEKKTLVEQKFTDLNPYPIKRLEEIRYPVKFPTTMVILEDQRLQIEIECSDQVDQKNVFVEFYIDNKLVNKSDSGYFTGPVIFREPGIKKFSIVAYDQKNMDGSFNAIKMELDVEVEDSRLTVKTLQKSN